MIRVLLPHHLRKLAGTDREISLTLDGQPTQRLLIDALEQQYPALRGTLRDPQTQKRRAFVRFFACEDDLSNDPPDKPLPEAVASGREPLHVVGAIAGG